MRRPLFVVCLCLVAIATLWLWHKNSSGEWGEQKFASPGEELTVIGRVSSKDTDSFTVDSIKLIQLSDAASSRQIIPRKIKLICENREVFPVVRIGSTVMVKGIFSECSEATNDGEFDGKSYYGGQNIFGKLTDVALYGESQKYSVMQEGLHTLREYFKGRINRVFPAKEASLMVAMLLGDKEGLDQELKELYQRNGIVHILAISGLHITLIGMSVYKLLRRLGMKIWLAAVCGGVLLCLYGVMTGMSLSACRAIGMYLIRMLAEIVGRSYDMLTALGVMAAILVCCNPGNLNNAGFLLSFGAILGIGILYPALLAEDELMSDEAMLSGRPLLSGVRGVTERYEPIVWKRILRDAWKSAGSGLGQAILSGSSITLFTLPIQLWFYYEIPIYSVFLNVLVLPFVSLVMVTGLVAMLVPGTGMVGTVAYVILKGYELVCECFEKLPFHTWNPGRPDVWQVVVYYAFVVLVVLWRKWNSIWYVVAGIGYSCKRKWFREDKRKNPGFGEEDRICGESRNKFGVGRYVVLGLAVGVFALHPPGEDRVTFVDVGQGDCIILETAEGEVYLFDCGSGSRKQVGEYVLLPFLKYHGIGRIDAVFVSHFDEDHCNGIRELLTWGDAEGITIGELVLPEVSERIVEEGLDTLLSEQRFIPLRFESFTEEGISAWLFEQENGTATEDFYIPVSYMSAGEIYPSTGANILCLHPPKGYGEEGNGASMCFYVEFSVENFPDAEFSDIESSVGNLQDAVFSLLLTGDVEGEGEERLLQELTKNNIRYVDVLKVAHHGSRNATSEAFLEQLTPEVAVISCGRNNRYGHPNAEVVERLEASGCEIFSTAESGQVTVVIDESIEIQAWLGDFTP